MHGDYEECEVTNVAIMDEDDNIVDVDLLRSAMDNPHKACFRQVVNRMMLENSRLTQSRICSALKITDDNFKFLYNRNETVNKLVKRKYKLRSNYYGESQTEDEIS